MKILFLTHYFYPHIGGVETHVLKISESLIKLGHEVSIVTERYSKKIKENESYKKITIKRFSYPKIRMIGLLSIWKWFLANKQLINNTDAIHIHDVFIWYLPFRVIFPNKKVYVTIHGLEWKDPFTFMGIFQKKIAVWWSTGSVGVGEFLEKYLKTKFNLTIYGAKNRSEIFRSRKIINKKIFLGRLEENTGILQFLEQLDKAKKWDVEFVGDGGLRSLCEKYGKVHGFTDPTPFLKKAEYVVPGGYLAYIEAKEYGCKTITFANNKLKEDYWKDIKRIKKFPTWDELAELYIKLWTSK